MGENVKEVTLFAASFYAHGLTVIDWDASGEVNRSGLIVTVSVCTANSRLEVLTVLDPSDDGVKIVYYADEETLSENYVGSKSMDIVADYNTLVSKASGYFEGKYQDYQMWHMHSLITQRFRLSNDEIVKLVRIKFLHNSKALIGDLELGHLRNSVDESECRYLYLLPSGYVLKEVRVERTRAEIEEASRKTPVIPAELIDKLLQDNPEHITPTNSEAHTND